MQMVGYTCLPMISHNPTDVPVAVSANKDISFTTKAWEEEEDWWEVSTDAGFSMSLCQAGNAFNTLLRPRRYMWRCGERR